MRKPRSTFLIRSVSSLIFEAALPNPHPTNAVVGCQQVAALWSSLKSLSDDQAKQALLKFYYSGGAISPGGLYFKPVVDFRNFGLLGAGQVRWNRAPQTSKPWHLRQWNIKLSSEFVGAPVFNAAPINETPVPAYFGGRAVEVIPMDADKVAKLQASFQNEFLCTNVKQLTSVEEADRSGNSVSAQELIAGIGVQVEREILCPGKRIWRCIARHSVHKEAGLANRWRPRLVNWNWMKPGG